MKFFIFGLLTLASVSAIADSKCVDEVYEYLNAKESPLLRERNKALREWDKNYGTPNEMKSFKKMVTKNNAIILAAEAICEE